MSFTFHNSFALKRSQISSVADVIRANPDVSLETLQAETGFGNKMVAPLRAWGRLTHLVGEAATGLTPVGGLILSQDKDLTNTLSQWVMHFHLTRPASEATAWSYFFQEFLPEYPEFHKDAFLEALKRRFGSEVSDKTLQRNCNLVLATYTDREALGGLYLLIKSGSSYRVMEGESLHPYLVGYFVALLWEENFSDAQTLDADVMLDLLGRITLGSKGELQRALDRLTGEGLIDQMRAVAPYQVIKPTMRPFAFIEKAIEAHA